MVFTYVLPITYYIGIYVKTQINSVHRFMDSLQSAQIVYEKRGKTVREHKNGNILSFMHMHTCMYLQTWVIQLHGIGNSYAPVAL